MNQPHDKMQGLQMLDISYISPTNSRGTRIKIYDMRFDETIIIPYDYSHNQVLDGAIAWLKKNTFLKPYGYGTTKHNYFIVIKPTDHTFESLKTSAARRKEGK